MGLFEGERILWYFIEREASKNKWIKLVKIHQPNNKKSQMLIEIGIDPGRPISVQVSQASYHPLDGPSIERSGLQVIEVMTGRVVTSY